MGLIYESGWLGEVFEVMLFIVFDECIFIVLN